MDLIDFHSCVSVHLLSDFILEFAKFIFQR